MHVVIFYQPKPLFEKMDSNKMEEFQQRYSGKQHDRNKVNYSMINYIQPGRTLPQLY